MSSFLFIATSGFSVYSLVYFRKHGSLPGAASRSSDTIEDQTKYAFSSNPHDELDEDVDDHGIRPERHEEDEHALLHTNTEDGTHPGRPLSWGREHAPSPFGGEGYDEADTSYHGGNYPQPPKHGHTKNTTKPYGPPAGTPLYDANHTTLPRRDYEPPRREAGDPFRDDLALSHDHGGYVGGNRVNFPDAEYHR